MLVNIFQLLSKLPLRILHGLGALFGWAVYWASPVYRSRLNENIRRAGFLDYLTAAMRQSGKSIFELPYLWYGLPARVMSRVSWENFELVEAAMARGRGVIFLTPHLGCFEITAQAVARKIPVTVLYRPPRKAALKPLVVGARERDNLALAPANLTGVRTLLKVLKKGGAIGLLPDQVPHNGEGVWADFFGAPAYTMTLPGKLYSLTGAPIILTYAERLRRGRGYLIRFFECDRDLGVTPEQQARAINAAMEQLIARCPEQYFWSYNRYKIPAGAALPKPRVGLGQ